MKKIINQIKIILLGIMLIVPYMVKAEGIGVDGVYHVKNVTLHDNPVGVAMSRSYMNETTEIIKEGDKLTAILEFNNTNYMGEFTVKVNNQVIAHELTYHNQEQNIKKISFPLTSLQDEVSVALYVIPMDTNVEFGVDFNEQAIECIKEAEKIENQEKNTENANTEQPAKKLDNEINQIKETTTSNIPKEEDSKVVEKEKVSNQEKKVVDETVEVAQEAKEDKKEDKKEEILEDKNTEEKQTEEKQTELISEGEQNELQKEDTQKEEEDIEDKQTELINDEEQEDTKHIGMPMIIIVGIGAVIIILGVKKWLKK